MRPGADLPLGLVTDLYELRMAQTCLREGLTAPATFTAYIRPATDRPWFLMAGAHRALEVLERFRYGPDELDYLADQGFGEELLDYLRDLEPAGEVWAIPDGTVFLGDEPLLEITAPLPYAMLLETALMNLLHFPTLIATKAARCLLSADGRTVVDFGLRRAHGLDAGHEAARAAFVGGCAGTSNVEAGRRFDLPIVGTMAHSFVQAWGDELTAFRAFATDHPDQSVLLVDTYDTIEGVRNAITIGEELREAGQDLMGVRLDSGDLADLARRSRAMLDDAGFPDAQIFASGNMDEFTIAELVAAGAPIDAFGVGTSMVTSRDNPAVDIVYKLAAYDGQPRAKYSPRKVSLPGEKQVFRTGGPDTDVLGVRDEDLDGERLLQPIWRDGEALETFPIDEVRDRARAQLAALPDDWRRPEPVDPAPTPRLSERMEQLAERVRRRELG